MEDLVIRRFQKRDQAATRGLILEGLRDHWGEKFSSSYNSDLINIDKSFEDGLFLVAEVAGRIVGTGAFLPEGEEVARVLRMSVASNRRRQGIGSQVLVSLCKRASQLGYKKIVLETTLSWEGVIAFYRQNGFEITHVWDGDVYFQLLLPS